VLLKVRSRVVGAVDLSTRQLLLAWDRFSRAHPDLAERLKPALKGMWRRAVRLRPDWGVDRYRQHVAAYHAAASTPHANAGVHVDGAEVAARYIAQVMGIPRQGEGTAVPFRAYPPESHKVRAIAFYLPQFHPIPENDEWWGRGFTEWANVTRAVPQFVGHDQPRVPADLGYYDLRLPDVQRQQVELARNYGIGGFCFHYYWFGGTRLLERPLDAYLADPSLDLPFCVSWANENWTRRWDGLDDEILMAQSSDPEDDVRFAASVIEYMRDERYIRVAGAPLLLVYRPSMIRDAKRTVERWRQTFHDAGIGDVFLASAQFDSLDPRPYGFDAAVEFPPHKLGRDLPRYESEAEIVNPEFGGTIHRYRDIVGAARGLDPEPYDLFRGVMPSWDNTARRLGRGTTFHGSTPEAYRDWLAFAGRWALEHPVKGESLVFVNAWNEWAEAAYLEPDRTYGFAYLEATRQALHELDRDGLREPRRVLLIVHDAHRHGAQLNALHIAQTATEVYGARLDIILLGGGDLLEEFRRWGTVHELGSIRDDVEAQDRLLGELRARGVERVLANTVVSARLLRQLHAHGFHVVSLVHELPGLIREYGLESEARDIARLADRVVFASEHVKTAFESLAGEVGPRALVRPQGLYQQPDSWQVSDATRRAARRELRIPEDAEVVLAVGFADLRKGIDLFMRVFAAVRRERPQALFVWLGCEDPEQVEWYTQEAAALHFSDSLRLLPRIPDVTRYYEAASVLLLPSREDPYPSVVLEALSHQVPVVAFEGATGCEDLLRSSGGTLVPYLDVAAMAEATMGLLSDRDRREAMGRRGQSIIREEYDWASYVGFLLGLGGQPPPSVSVIVPNFNHARYLRQRLTSIRDQTYPVKEVIVLDDASTDDSIETLRRLRDELGLPFTLVANEANSGSVFRQWATGVDRSSGDLVWIAESDDFAEPTFLARIVACFDDPAVVMAYSESRQVDRDGVVLAEHYRDYVRDIDPRKWLTSWQRPGSQELADSLSVKNTIPNVSAVLFRRQRLADVLDDEMAWISSFEIAGDWAVYVACLLRGGDIAFVAEPLNNHRRHDEGVTIKSFGRKIVAEIERMQGHVRGRVSVPAESARVAREYIGELEVQFDLKVDGQNARLLTTR
jgi:O-antigen biosynthesis protein